MLFVKAVESLLFVIIEFREVETLLGFGQEMLVLDLGSRNQRQSVQLCDEVERVLDVLEFVHQNRLNKWIKSNINC